MKLLVIEDDPKISAAVQRGLLAEGFSVDLADNGDDGWWRASEGNYDVIVLDIMLPGRNGFVICRDLRSRGNWTPILMLTAKDGDLDEAEGLDTGADDYLTKPFSFAVLIARIRALARRVQHGDRVEQTVGTLSVDSASRKVRVGDVDVELTRREFDVLEFLIRRAGQAVSKDAILTGVWDLDFDGDPNIVEVYVGRLRRKIDDPFGTAHISTVRGVGYRIDGDDREHPS